MDTDTKISTPSVPMFNQEALKNQLKSVEETITAVVAYELHRHRRTYGNISSYEQNKIHKDVEFYFNSLPCD